MNDAMLEYINMLWAVWVLEHGYEPVESNRAWTTKEIVNAELDNQVAMTTLIEIGMIIDHPHKYYYQLNKEYRNGTNQSK